jgi:hypothetical protein
MLVALGDKPARRARSGSASSTTQPPALQWLAQTVTRRAKGEVTPATTRARARSVQTKRVPTSAPLLPHPTHTQQDAVQAEATTVDADLASDLIASGVTTQPLETVIAVLASYRDGASINAAAKASGINYRTAQRIVEASLEHRQRQLLTVS